MSAVVVVAAGAAGLVVGPVLNVLIDRVPSKAPLRGEREGEASAPMSWFGLPAQPWMLRQGRSADGALPRRWLAVEVVTVVGFMAMAVQYSSWELVPLLLLTASLITVSVIDLQLLRIPDRITFPTLALSLPLLLLVSSYRDTVPSLRAAVVGSLVYFVLLFIPHFAYPRGMGFGDVKLALVMGLYLGWVGWSPEYPVIGPVRLVLYTLILGCLLGAVFGVTAQLVARRRGAFPFGPALAMGCYAIVYFANDLQL